MRRREHRYVPPPSLSVEVHIMGQESLNILRARDISLSGLGVHAPHSFQPADLGNELDLLITLPGARTFLARGTVRHRNNLAVPNFFGVEFTELKVEHRGLIRDFIERLAKLEASDRRAGAG